MLNCVCAMCGDSKCKKLADINIYRIDHNVENLRYVELYFDEHMRLIVIPVSQDTTMVSMDVYPFECNTDPNPNKKCTTLTTPHIELCSYSFVDAIRDKLGYGLQLVLINVEALLLCLREEGKRKCEVINLKLFILRDLSQVLEMCIEDFQQVVNAVKSVCTS